MDELESLRAALREHGAESACQQAQLMEARRELERLRGIVRWFRGDEWAGMCVTGAVRRRVAEVLAGGA